MSEFTVPKLVFCVDYAWEEGSKDMVILICVFSPFGGGAPRGSPNPKFGHPLYGGYCILLTELFCILFKTSLIPTLMFIILRDYQPEGKPAGFHIIIMRLLCRLIDSE